MKHHRRAISLDERGRIVRTKVITSDSLAESGKLAPKQGLPGGSGILPDRAHGKALKSQLMAKIDDVAGYDAEEVDDDVLRDDFRIVLAWYATLKEDGKFRYDEKVIRGLLKKILVEAKARGAQAIRFDPEGMKKSVRAFFLSVAHEVGIPSEQFKGQVIAKQIRPNERKLFFYLRLPPAVRMALSEFSKDVAKESETDVEDVDHITLLYVEAPEGKFSHGQAAKALEAAKDALAGAGKITVKLQGWGFFDGASQGGVNKTALVALVDAAGLAEVYVKLKEALAKEGIEASEEHGFIPHATIAYLEPGTRLKELPMLGNTFEVTAAEMSHSGLRQISMKRQPFGIFGGSYRYAKKLAPMLPEHKTYVEPFAGAAALLYVKEPSEKEVISDLNEDVAFMHKYIQGMTEEKLEELKRFDWVCSKQEYERVKKLKPKSDAERFHKLAYDLNFSFGNKMGGGLSNNKIESAPEMDPAKYLEAAQRIKDVKVINQDYKKTIAQFDGPGTFFFLDPPYPDEWTAHGEEIDLDDFIATIGKIKGKFIAVLNQNEEHTAAFKEIGNVFRIKVQESAGKGGAKSAYRVFCSNFKVSKQDSGDEIPEVEIDEIEKSMWGSPGGKAKLAKKLIAWFPEHKTYVEAFAGSGAVFFAKDPVETEVLNDADPEISEAYRIIKKLTDDQLKKLGEMNWVGSENLFKDLSKAKPSGELEKLHKFLYTTNFSYGKLRGKSFNPHAAGVESRVIARIETDRVRLKNAKLYSGDYEKPIKEHDGVNTLFFLDPPYPGYDVQIGEEDFDEERFLKVLKGIKGKFMVTYGNRGELPKRFEKEGFHVKRVLTPRTIRTMRGVGGDKMLVNLVVTNYKLPLKSVEKRVSLMPGTDPSKLTDAQLKEAHWLLHQIYRDKGPKATADRFSTEDISNLHARMVDEMFERDIPHPPPPDEGLDEISSDFEQHTEKQPDYWSPPARRRVRKEEVEFAKVHSSGVERGREITLEEVLPYFKSFKVRKPAVYLVGGLAANGKTKGDIDILIKEGEGTPPAIRHMIEFRIGRSLPPELNSRVEFHFDKFSGPFTNFVELYDMTLERINPKNEIKMMRDDSEDLWMAESRAASRFQVVEAERARKEDKLVPGEFFYQPKPTRAANPEEAQSVERFLAMYQENKDWLPAVVQKKYDGARHQIHKIGDKVLIFSEDGDNNTNRLPGLVAEVQRLKPEKLVLDAEIEAWKGKQHLPREAVAGYLNEKGEPDDGFLVANVFDVLYLDEDIHKEPLAERLAELEDLRFSQATISVPNLRYRLNRVPSVEVEDADELEKAVRSLRVAPGSEGVVTKQVDSTYPLAPVTSDTWVKYHNATLVHGIVIDRKATKDNKAWVYSWGVLPGRTKAKKTISVEGKDIVPVGDSFGTKIDLKNGDGILVEAETVNLTNSPEGQEITAWVPRVLGEDSGKTDTVDSAASTAAKNLVLQVKDVDAEGKTSFRPTGAVEKQEDPFLEIPGEDQRHPFVVQQHFRGKGVHSDLRVGLTTGKLLIGWTLSNQIKDSIKEPVTTLAQAREVVRERMGEYSKIDWRTGEWAQRPKAGAGKLVRAEIYAERKAPEPWEWLNVEGATKAPEEGERPPVGGTRNFPGVFVIVSQGDAEYGAQKPWFHEYFLHGRGTNYRIIFRQLRLGPTQKEDEIWNEPPEGASMRPEVAKVVLPPSEPEAGALSGEAIWVAIRPDDLLPYVLDPEAVKKAWIPPVGVSALPRAVRSQVPSEFRYWEQLTEEKARSMRDALVEAMKSGEVKIDLEAIFKVRKASPLEAEFVLQEQTWKGPVVIRTGPSKRVWWLRVDTGRPELMAIKLFQSPIDNQQIAAEVTSDSHPGSMELEGDIKPGHYLNPTKDTSSNLAILDKGKASVLSASGDFIKLRLDGKHVKGIFALTRNDAEWLWAPAQESPETEKRDNERWKVGFEVPITKVDEAKREITGIVLEPDEIDAQLDIISEEVISQAAHHFLADYNRATQMGLMHRLFGGIGVELYESWITREDSKLEGQKVKKGSWLMTIHVLSDQLWERVQRKEITGFSIGGSATLV